MSNLTPVPRADKNGKIVTRHMKPQGSDKNPLRDVSVPTIVTSYSLATGKPIIKTAAELTFPEYQLEPTLLERVLRSKTKRHKALTKVMSLVQQSATLDYTLDIKQLSGEKDQSRRIDRAEHAERTAYTQYLKLMAILDGLETETLEFIANSYSGKLLNRTEDRFLSALSPSYYYEIEGSGEDLNMLVKNVISYREEHVSWERQYVNAFNDVRLSAPELDRPDLYNLTGDDRKWVATIIRVSQFSQLTTGSLDEDDDSPHMNPELALLLKEEPEWEKHVKDLVLRRGMKASHVTPDLIKGIRETGARVLNGGML